MKLLILLAALAVSASEPAAPAPAKRRRKPAAAKPLKPVPKPGLRASPGMISTFSGPASTSAGARVPVAPTTVAPSPAVPAPANPAPSAPPPAIVAPPRVPPGAPVSDAKPPEKETGKDKGRCGKAQCYWIPNPEKNPLQPNICVESCPAGMEPWPLVPPLPDEWGVPGAPGNRACGCVKP